MRVIKIKQGWNYDDENLVSPYGKLTDQGLDQFWSSLDASVKFNYTKRVEFLARNIHPVQSERENLAAMTEDTKKIRTNLIWSSRIKPRKGHAKDKATQKNRIKNTWKNRQ